ncbi:MAG: hypothetical protein AVDCRST_MAG73-2756, partial [uncultured Thermomicrobiales bacterium]
VSGRVGVGGGDGRSESGVLRRRCRVRDVHGEPEAAGQPQRHPGAARSARPRRRPGRSSDSRPRMRRRVLRRVRPRRRLPAVRRRGRVAQHGRRGAATLAGTAGEVVHAAIESWDYPAAFDLVVSSL